MSRMSWILSTAAVCALALTVSASWAQEEEPGGEGVCAESCYEDEDACYEACQGDEDADSCEEACDSNRDACLAQCE